MLLTFITCGVAFAGLVAIIGRDQLGMGGFLLFLAGVLELVRRVVG